MTPLPELKWSPRQLICPEEKPCPSSGITLSHSFGLGPWRYGELLWPRRQPFLGRPESRTAGKGKKRHLNPREPSLSDLSVLVQYSILPAYRITDMDLGRPLGWLGREGGALAQGPGLAG